MFAIAPGMPPHVCLRQGRWRPAPRIYAAGKVIDFALVAVYGKKHGSVCPRQGSWRPTSRFCATGAGGVTKAQICAGSGAPAAKHSASDSNSYKIHRWSTWQKQIFRDRALQQPACFARRPQLESLEWQYHLILPFGITRARHPNFLLPVPNSHTELLMFTRPSRFLFPRTPCIQAASSREILLFQGGL
jgi:hypothetical protein